jgi:hypothetical protein
VIPGEPLPTGMLPRTRVIASTARSVPSGRISKQWPKVPDPEPDELVKGQVAFVHGRLRMKRYRIRMIGTSRQRRNRGRRFVVGMDRRGFLHYLWADQVMSVQSVRAALASARAVRQITGDRT